jgi:cell division septation protein DedD
MPEFGMPVTPQPATPSAHAPLPAAVPNASETATTALYRAALGPVNTSHYLSVFARFDETGRAGPGWNWAAALLTLNWLVFRQLWGVALVYVAAVEGLALLVLGLGAGVLAAPSLAESGFLAALLLLSCLIPGVYGNAWLHADARRRMTRAVRDARTVRDACADLAQRASTRRRLIALLVINLLLALVVVGAYLGLSRWVPYLSGAQPVVLPAPRTVELALPASQPVPATVLPAPPAEPVPPVPMEPAPVPTTPPVAPAVTELAPPVLKPESAPPTAMASTSGFAINVGLFADANNADRVHTRLIDAGLPAFIQVVDSPHGQRTRVRVGPFASRALADEAAGRIRALGLDAVVFRQ